MTYQTTKNKTKSTKGSVIKQKTIGPTFNPFERTFKMRGRQFGVQFSKLSGESQKCRFFPKLPDLYMESSFGNISRWVAYCATNSISIFLSLQHCLHQISPLSKTTFFYEFSFKKLVLWGFRGYLIEIESERKMSEFFIYCFFRTTSGVSR